MTDSRHRLQRGPAATCPTLAVASFPSAGAFRARCPRHGHVGCKRLTFLTPDQALWIAGSKRTEAGTNGVHPGQPRWFGRVAFRGSARSMTALCRRWRTASLDSLGHQGRAQVLPEICWVPKKHPRRLPDGRIILIRRKGGLPLRADPERHRFSQPDPAGTGRGLWPPADLRHAHRVVGAMAPAGRHGARGRGSCFPASGPCVRRFFRTLSGI
jgi:hypothetical protein